MILSKSEDQGNGSQGLTVKRIIAMSKNTCNCLE